MRQPLGLEEHVLGAAQPDALGAQRAGPLGVARVVGVGVDLARRRKPSAHLEQLEQVRVVERGLPGVERAPGRSRPVVPSSETSAPSLSTTLVRATVASRFVSSTSRAITPTTAGLPNCRATSAAWLVRPPRLVMMPLLASMPCTSSGLVSARIMMTSRFSLLSRTASSASKASRPVAAPGETLRPVATSRPSARAAFTAAGSNCGWR